MPGFSDRGTTDAGGVADISRWCEPPVTDTKCGEPRRGDGIRSRAISPAPAGARVQCCNEPVVCTRLRRANFQRFFGATRSRPASTLEMRSVLDGLRSKTSLNRYSANDKKEEGEVEIHSDSSAARRREARIKKWSRAKKCCAGNFRVA